MYNVMQVNENMLMLLQKGFHLILWHDVILTHSIWQIRPLFPRSNWNMGEILAFLA